MEEGEKQEWRVYSPEGVDTHLHTKMALRTMSKVAPFLGRGERYVQIEVKDDNGDDLYVMNVNEEKVAVLARERGQRSRFSEAFGDLEEGIFYLVTDSNREAAESKLVKAFG
jgi:hypothetical protein